MQRPRPPAAPEEGSPDALLPYEARENHAHMLREAALESGYAAEVVDRDPDYVHVKLHGGGTFWEGLVYFHDYVDMLLKDPVSGTLVPKVMRYSHPDLHEDIHGFLKTEFPRFLPPHEWGD